MRKGYYESKSFCFHCLIEEAQVGVGLCSRRSKNQDNSEGSWFVLHNHTNYMARTNSQAYQNSFHHQCFGPPGESVQFTCSSFCSPPAIAISIKNDNLQNVCKKLKNLPPLKLMFSWSEFPKYSLFKICFFDFGGVKLNADEITILWHNRAVQKILLTSFILMSFDPKIWRKK